MQTLFINRNLIVSIFVVLLLTYGVQGISYGQDAPDDTIVEFNDTNLAKAVRRALGLPTGDGVDILKIPKAELEKLTGLSHRHGIITNLIGLEHATQLKVLVLYGNDVIDITPLAQLTQLKKLDLGSNYVNDITPLAQLTQLTELDLRYNNISDITPLASLVNLQKLWLIGNPIPDTSPLASLLDKSPDLEIDILVTTGPYVEFANGDLANAVRRELGLPVGYGTGFLKIPKAELGKITSLNNSWYREITDLTGLEHATQLSVLDISLTIIGRGGPLDLTPLAQLTQLTTLTLWNNNIIDITPLAQLTKLRTLNLRENQITDITPLTQLTQLTTLNLSKNQVYDVTPLAQLTQLRTLDLSENEINDVTPLTQLTQLTKLDLSKNQVNDVTPLAQLTRLTELDLEDNNIIDITPLAKLTLLNDLDISKNFITDVTPLAQLIRLETLNLSHMNSLKDIIPLAQLPRTRIFYADRKSVFSDEILLLAVSTLQPLASTTLDGSSVTLTLIPSGAAYDTSIDNIRNALTITGIPGVTVSDVVHVSDKELKVTLGFTGSLEKRTTLIISIGQEAVTGYEGRVLTGGTDVYPEVPHLYPEEGSESDHIQGPWLWMVVPTDPAVGEGISTEIDSLADASEGGITEVDVAQNGVNAGDAIGQLQWVSSEIHWSEHHCQKFSVTSEPNIIFTIFTLGLLADDCIDPTVCWANNINNLVDTLGMGTELASGERTAYAFINVVSSSEQNVVMSVKSGDAIKIWLNGSVVHRESAENYGCRKVEVLLACDPEICTTDPAIQESETSLIPVTLKVGNNPLLVKVREHGEYWDMRIGLTGDFTTEIPTEAIPTTRNLLSISPSPVQSPAIGEQLELNLNIAGGENVAGYQTTVQFDETALRYVSSANGDYLPAGAYFVEPVVEGNLIKLNAVSLAGESNGNGTLATITFEVIAAKASTLTLSDVLLTNSAGKTSVPNIENAQITGPEGLKSDVNGDGTVNIADLALVAGALGTTGQNAADVNGDGTVDIADLVLVAGALGTSTAAPSLNTQFLSTLTTADVKQWLSEAQQLNLTDTTSQRGILFLQQLLAALTPKKTALLANYPNPFNPETWIPYHLAKDADVTLHIYAVNGTLVRSLTLGHQASGMYQNRSSAAYWDGNNAFGESVASGLYFYTLTAGDFSATRKMLIRK